MEIGMFHITEWECFKSDVLSPFWVQQVLVPLRDYEEKQLSKPVTQRLQFGKNHPKGVTLIHRWRWFAQKASRTESSSRGCSGKKYWKASCSTIGYCRESQLWTSSKLLFLLKTAADTLSVVEWAQTLLKSWDNRLHVSAYIWLRRSTLAYDYHCSIINLSTIRFIQSNKKDPAEKLR